LGAVALACLGMGASACEQTTGGDEALISNPFTDSAGEGKADTAYINLRGTELEVSIEADVEASAWQIFDGPAEVMQYAVTYLRNRNKIYLEILGEDVTAKDRVEWRVDGAWLTYAQAKKVDKSKLRHFRYRGANVVVQYGDAAHVNAGDVLKAEVPLRPYKTMTEGGDGCATPNAHLGLSQSIYWYLWNPNRYTCSIETQTMTLTVDRVLPRNVESYPEYNRLWKDNKLEVAVFFGQLDSDVDDMKDDNWQNVDQLAQWLTDAGFKEVKNAPMGRRFTHKTGDKTAIVDVYGPSVFHSVADSTRFANWQKAVSEHEVIMYNGHSVLGSGMAFERATYPDHYQIFQIASCLSYEYYVRPILAGKGGWADVDVISNTTPTYYNENLPLTSTVLAKLIEGFENGGRVSWQDIMEAVARKLNHYRFGVSGARDNCFTPSGDRCTSTPDPKGNRYENTTPAPIPDNDPAGATSTLSVNDDIIAGSVKLEVDITHAWVGDLTVTVSHDGVDEVVWKEEGRSDDDIRQTFTLKAFDGKSVAGTWTVKVVDSAARDAGTLNTWALLVTPTSS
ncbi:MAG: proprotein convertase P-domain-containing protein, partial [Deltaproteobacteria bacterium]|nr:proprotein convertase P-domain-containing protein [Deltaproteobacteria bacterium]